MKILLSFLCLFIVSGCSFESSEAHKKSLRILEDLYITGYQDGLDCAWKHDVNYCEVIELTKIKQAFAKAEEN